MVLKVMAFESLKISMHCTVIGKQVFPFVCSSISYILISLLNKSVTIHVWLCVRVYISHIASSHSWNHKSSLCDLPVARSSIFSVLITFSLILCFDIWNWYSQYLLSHQDNLDFSVGPLTSILSLLCWTIDNQECFIHIFMSWLP